MLVQQFLILAGVYRSPPLHDRRKRGSRRTAESCLIYIIIFRTPGTQSTHRIIRRMVILQASRSIIRGFYRRGMGHNERNEI
jgi:hypothetical protein